MKIQEVQIGQDYKEIEGILNFANQQTQTITTGQGKQINKQNIAVDGVAGDFWCGDKPFQLPDCNNPIKLMCKASVYQGQTQYNFKRIKTGGGGFGRGKSQQEIDETRRSVAFSYLVDKQKLGLSWMPETFLKANILEKWIRDGQMPVTYSQGTGGGTTNPKNYPNPDPSIQQQDPQGDPSNFDWKSPASDDNIPI